MSLLTTLFNGGDFVKTIDEKINRRFASDEDAFENEMELTKSNRKLLMLENKVSTGEGVAKTERRAQASVKSRLYTSGWRPAVGWIGAAALLYHYVVYPVLLWVPMAPPPLVDSAQLYPIIMGMLGIAGMRSYDKKMGTDTKSM